MTKRLVGIACVMLALGTGVAAAGEREDWAEATTRAWEAAFNAGDVAALAAVYAEDGMLLPPNTEAVEGRAAIAEFWTGMMTPGLTGSLAVQEDYSSGDLAYKMGTYEVRDADGAIVDRGTFIEVWMELGGEWQLYRDIWNSSLPLTAGESSAE